MNIYYHTTNNNNNNNEMCIKYYTTKDNEGTHPCGKNTIIMAAHTTIRTLAQCAVL